MVSKDIPDEITGALAKGQGFLLLIKGEAGTGKTTLALEIMRDSENAYYFSTRTPPAYFVKHFPDVAEIIGANHIFDATQLPTFEMTPSKRPATLAFEKIQFQDLSEFFEIIAEKVKAPEKSGSPTVVIDSWDALIQLAEERTELPSGIKTRQLEKVIYQWIQSAKINLVLINENAAPTNLDFFADAIILLKDTRLNGLRVRRLEIKKLSIGAIQQPEYVFSLEQAHFRYFEPYKFKFPEILLRPDPNPDLNINAISTGMPSFDELLQNGYPQGSWNLFELSEGVGQGFLQLLIPTLVNQLNLGRGVVATLPEGISLKNFEIYLEGFVEGEKIAQYFILFDRPPIMETIRSKTAVLGDTLLDTLNDFHRQEDLFASYIDGPVLKILGLSKLQNIYSTGEIKKYIPNEVVYTKSSTNITLAFVKEDQDLVNSLSHLATRHYKLEMIDKALFLRGIQPQTDYVGICPIISGGYLDTKFINVT